MMVPLSGRMYSRKPRNRDRFQHYKRSFRLFNIRYSRNLQIGYAGYADVETGFGGDKTASGQPEKHIRRGSEDNKTNQFIVREILEQSGFQVSLADNGEEGVNYYRDHREKIDLILMDLHMPVMNGYEASAEIRKLDPAVPIVAMTADAITGVDEECRRVGIDHYISKPYDPEKLMDTLLHILERQLESGNAKQPPDSGYLRREEIRIKRIRDPRRRGRSETDRKQEELYG
jgi:CheY-like chemotaxis protein